MLLHVSRKLSKWYIFLSRQVVNTIVTFVAKVTHESVILITSEEKVVLIFHFIFKDVSVL